MAEQEKVCTACAFCISNDFGYSNYTVEGTSNACLFDLNPNGVMSSDEKDEKQAEWNKYAETCDHYREGTGIYIDCDGETKQESVREWIRMHIKSAA